MKHLPRRLAALASGAVGEIAAVTDRSWPRDNSAVWQVTDASEGRWFVKRHPSERTHDREVFAYQHWASALGPAGAPVLAAADRQLLAVIVSGLPGHVVWDMRLTAGDEREVHRQAGVLLRRFHHVVATGEPRPGDLALPGSQRPDLPSAFADLVVSLLSESPDDRPQDAEDVLQRLGEIRHASDIDAFIAAGENNEIEFKSSLHHPHGPLPEDLQKKVDYQNMPPAQAKKEVQKRLNMEVTKTIAAFLNTDGGTLLVGVDDSGTVLGIKPDFEYCKSGKQNADGWLLSLKQVVINALGTEVWSAVHASLVPREQKTVAVVRCPPDTSETWHHADRDRFYMRASNATEELTGPGLVRYIRERWPA